MCNYFWGKIKASPKLPFDTVLKDLNNAVYYYKKDKPGKMLKNLGYAAIDYQAFKTGWWYGLAARGAEKTYNYFQEKDG